MSKQNKISVGAYILFALIYFNQGIWGIHSDPIYYLMRDHWHLSLTKMAFIGSLATIPWTIKPIWGIIVDSLPLFKKKTKYWLILNYILIILISLWVIIFGLNIISLIITGILFAICFSFNDVAGDGLVCRLEKKFNLQGKLQAVSWFCLSMASLTVAFGGAYIAENYNYKIAYILGIICPTLMIFFIAKYCDEPDEKRKPINWDNLKEVGRVLFTKKMLIPTGFLFFYFLSPSFGLALQTHMKEVFLMGKIEIGILRTVGTVFGMLGYLLYFFKFHKFNIIKLLYFTVGFGAFSTLWYLWIPSKEWLWGYAIILGTIGAISHLVILAYVAKITPKGHEAIVFAGLCSVLNLGSMGSGMLGGFLYDFTGYNWLVIISAIATVLCLLFIPHLKIGEENECIN